MLMRQPHRLALVLTILAMLAALGTLPVAPVHAQEPGGSADDAIALAEAQPEIAAYLNQSGDWDAAAYFSGNRFGVWRVHFWNEDGNDLGYADLSLERGIVYSWQPADYLDEALWTVGENAVWDFVRANEDVRAVLGVYGVDYDEDPFDGWTEYRAESNTWSAYIWQAGDFIEARVRFDTGNRQVFENPVLVGIYFPNVLNIWEWQKAQETQAISLAFNDAGVAAVLRGLEGWTGAAEPEDWASPRWRVTFSVADAAVLTATVDMETQAVLDFGAP